MAAKKKEILPSKVKILKKPIIGWKEWFNLESVGLPAIKGKIDTGAKTSALHAFDIENFRFQGEEYVKFYIHPLQKNKKLVRCCVAKVIDQRVVSDSSGRKERRYVIKSLLLIGEKKVTVEITLANRDSMTFRMLLGRDAVKQLKMIVDPSKSFVQSKVEKKEILDLYQKVEEMADPRN